MPLSSSKAHLLVNVSRLSSLYSHPLASATESPQAATDTNPEHEAINKCLTVFHLRINRQLLTMIDAPSFLKSLWPSSFATTHCVTQNLCAPRVIYSTIRSTTLAGERKKLFILRAKGPAHAPSHLFLLFCALLRTHIGAQFPKPWFQQFD